MSECVAFMIMPFDVKPTASRRRSAPRSVDFDAVWHRIHKPVLERLGYRAVRADGDTGALIISEMLQRLALADLVVADISLANANVYYEVGVRHAARERGCVLVSADWGARAFDVDQMRRVAYPLPDGTVGDVGARRARESLSSALPAVLEGSSPVFQAVPGYPADIELEGLPVFADVVDELQAFDARMETIRAAPLEDRRRLTEALLVDHASRPVVRDATVLQVLRLVRDCIGWNAVIDYTSKLPDRLRRHPTVLEQRLLARARSGDPLGAIGALEALIEKFGETSERQGLLGGRYKQMMRQSSGADRRRYLNLAIDAYARGMQLDLNDYYPSSNLPRLYRARGREEDEHAAVSAAAVAAAACQRSINLGTDDEWTRPTLLGAAFDGGDVTGAEDFLAQIEDEGAARWTLDITMPDLEDAIAFQADQAVAEGLRAVLTQIRQLVSAS